MEDLVKVRMVRVVSDAELVMAGAAKAVERENPLPEQDDSTEFLARFEQMQIDRHKRGSTTSR